ncbi:hypothetical protein CDEST_02079 [Colletotrichum destructivum]|uniref:Uncharacterized protein n=1 Tax=Colletotrichum destructivum TaxID=34406 RepID=A0AAX4I141_9PEZI|nr:hypothetical protein CDEST_02079 [Colletotrichum destructivum]
MASLISSFDCPSSDVWPKAVGATVDSVSTSMTANCRAFSCKGTGIKMGEKCSVCGWERPSGDAAESESASEGYPGFSCREI